MAVVFKLDFNECRPFKASFYSRPLFPGHGEKKHEDVCHEGTEISKILSICLFYSALGGIFSLYFQLYF